MGSTELSAIHAELASIRVTLYVIGFLVVLSVVVTGYRTYRYVKHQLKATLDDLFRTEAQDLIDKGDSAGVVKLACGKLAERPNHVDAHWYLARALMLEGDLKGALSEFETTRGLAPSWSQDHIDPWVKQIEERLRTEAIH